MYFFSRGLWSKVTLTDRETIEHNEQEFGEEDPRNIEFTRMLASYVEQGPYNEGEKAWLQALTLSVKVHGEKDLTTIKIMQLLATISYIRGWIKDAVKLHMKIFSLLHEDP